MRPPRQPGSVPDCAPSQRGAGPQSVSLFAIHFPPPDFLSCLKTVHLRHLHIHQNQIEIPFVLLESGKGFYPIDRHSDRVTLSLQQPRRNCPVHRVILHYQNMKPLTRRGHGDYRLPRGAGCRGSIDSWGTSLVRNSPVKKNVLPTVRTALNPDLPVHQFDKMRRNGEA